MPRGWGETLPAQPSSDPPKPPLLQSAFESDISEVILCQNEVDLALRNLQAWMKDEPAATNTVSPAGAEALAQVT